VLRQSEPPHSSSRNVSSIPSVQCLPEFALGQLYHGRAQQPSEISAPLKLSFRDTVLVTSVQHVSSMRADYTIGSISVAARGGASTFELSASTCSAPGTLHLPANSRATCKQPAPYVFMNSTNALHRVLAESCTRRTTQWLLSSTALSETGHLSRAVYKRNGVSPNSIDEERRIMHHLISKQTRDAFVMLE